MTIELFLGVIVARPLATNVPPATFSDETRPVTVNVVAERLPPGPIRSVPRPTLSGTPIVFSRVKTSVPAPALARPPLPVKTA